MSTIYTDDITVSCQPCGPDAWQIDFTSPHTGLCHQLYANGRLADWTDTATTRRLVFHALAQAAQLQVAAVDPSDRTRELHILLPAASVPAWVFRTFVAPPAAAPADAVICLLTDAGGVDTLLAQRPAYPPNAPRMGMGLDAFGKSACGYGAGLGAGLGNGVFGLSPMGMDRVGQELTAALTTEGLQHVRVSIRWPGGMVDLPAQSVLAMPPSTPPRAITVVDVDTRMHVLTVEITR